MDWHWINPLTFYFAEKFWNSHWLMQCKGAYHGKSNWLSQKNKSKLKSTNSKKVKCAFRLITGIDFWQKLRKIVFGSLIDSEPKGGKTLYCSAGTHFKWGKMRRLDERRSYCFQKLSWKNECSHTMHMMCWRLCERFWSVTQLILLNSNVTLTQCDNNTSPRKEQGEYLHFGFIFFFGDKNG